MDPARNCFSILPYYHPKSALILLKNRSTLPLLICMVVIFLSLATRGILEMRQLDHFKTIVGNKDIYLKDLIFTVIFIANILALCITTWILRMHVGLTILTAIWNVLNLLTCMFSLKLIESIFEVNISWLLCMFSSAIWLLFSKSEFRLFNLSYALLYAASYLTILLNKALLPSNKYLIMYKFYGMPILELALYASVILHMYRSKENKEVELDLVD